MTRTATAILVFAGFIAAPPARGDDVADRMYRLVPPLTNLASTVEGAVRYKNLAPEVDGAELLEIATRHDRRLLAPFAGYVVRVQRQGQHAVVLVCSPRQHVALFEDSGCTAKPDRHHWRSEVVRPCAFTLDAAATCSERAAAP